MPSAGRNPETGADLRPHLCAAWFPTPTDARAVTNSGMPARLKSVPFASLVATAAVIAVIYWAVSMVPPVARPRPVPTVGVISGRIVDPHRLRPDGAKLRVWRHRGLYTATSFVVVPNADGTFVTPPLPAGLYVIELVRTTAVGPSDNVLGVRVVDVVASDSHGVTIDVRAETAITGRFRMLSDDPLAEWPVYTSVAAYLAIDGRDPLVPVYAEGAPEGAFVLRNAVGPRTLRVYYRNPAGSQWWPLRTLLDGRDVTNVPVDFSAHPKSRLEIVLTQHPARLTGTVVDGQGRPVPGAWITVTGTDAAARQVWASTADATDTNTRGMFSIAMPPGEYRVAAVPPSALPHLRAARHRAHIATAGVLVRLEERAATGVTLTLQPP